nr:recombinase family protein [uncultured Escherichia sp.]
MKQNGKAYSYIRFSSKKQEQGDSVRRQIALAEHYAHANNLILSDKNFQDLGISVDWPPESPDNQYHLNK